MQYAVEMECVVRKIVICEGCTAEQARAEPFKYAVDENVGETVDWNVLSVTESK